ncbi:MAG: methyl-accepting chemotaxis protein [Muribaculaceae bacterium]|nr:methyl-accepting chemotaxis protein [Muribaculaceae bacterium]
MKERVRRISIRMKILLLSNVLILLICGSMGISAYRRLNEGMVSAGVEEARMAAQIITEVIDGDLVEGIGPGSEGTESYETLLNTMRGVQEDIGIAYLYTLYTDGSQIYYGVDTDKTEQQAKAGEVFDVPYEELADVFAGEEYAEDEIDHTEDGDLISVYKPILDSTGKIVGIIGCDYDAANVVKKLNQMTLQIIMTAVVCIVISVFLMNLLVGQVMKSLNLVNGKIYDLVHSEGDLTQKLEITTGDETELIANNVNLLLEYIRGIMLNIRDNSNQLVDSVQSVVQNLSGAEMRVTDVSSTMEEMSAAMEETSAALTQVDESIGIINGTMEQISADAGNERDSAQEVMKKAAKINEEAVLAQENAKIQVQEMAASVNEKIEKSKSVEEINVLTENIIEITEETNLLALNASIEAARAGDAGRGFAVVADEIGKLANNSAQTAVQIQNVSAAVIEAVNELAQNAEMMLKFMDETAMGGYRQLLETSESYRSDVGNMSEMMKTFAEESAQVKRSIDQIKESISAVSIAVSESAKGITNVTEVSVDLTAKVGNIGGEANTNMNIANQLTGEVNKFKL